MEREGEQDRERQRCTEVYVSLGANPQNWVWGGKTS